MWELRKIASAKGKDGDGDEEIEQGRDDEGEDGRGESSMKKLGMCLSLDFDSRCHSEVDGSCRAVTSYSSGQIALWEVSNSFINSSFV
mgnify:FL=1